MSDKHIKQIRDLLGDIVPAQGSQKKKKVAKKKRAIKKVADREKALVKKGDLSQKKLDDLVADALAIEAESAMDADKIGFMCRALTQATMPHKKTGGNEFTRRNGNFRMTIMAPSEVGLPYGTIPRLLMIWVATEAVTSRSKTLVLGTSLSAFMHDIDLDVTGGRWGSIPRLKEQMKRLFSSTIIARYDDPEHTSTKVFPVVESSDLWWSPQKPGQAAIWDSTLTLSDTFFEEIISNPVPVDLRAIAALKKSPLALDIYVWLTYRVSYLKGSTAIPWALLQAQFGAGYPSTPRGLRNFKASFLAALKKVHVVYPAVNVADSKNGLLLTQSKTHIPKAKKPIKSIS